ncbi:hypothetical protein LCGC14_1469480 [marine sediment metagenome]|uniref:Uncharacterized protein n=1 Tax=marine sediment metagenome TaxID=412755 RepID=A0A0F9JYP0_9ZZZZ
MATVPPAPRKEIFGLPDGIPNPIWLTWFEKLRTEVNMSFKNFYVEVKKGNVPGHSLIHKFGRNDAVADAVWEGIHQLSTTFNFLTASTPVRIKAGGNVNDDAGGTGMQKLVVVGLDSDGNQAEETITANGGSASTATTTSFWRVFRLYIPDGGCGTYGSANTGIVTVENSGGGTDLIMITATEGQSQYGAYAIPAGKTGYLLSVEVEADTKKPADFRMFTRNNLTDFSAPFSPRRIRLHFDGIDGPDTHNPDSPFFALPALTDIWMEAEGAGAQTEVSVDFELLLVDD